MSIDVQGELAQKLEASIPQRRGLIDRDPEYRALTLLAKRNRKHPPKTPLDALQHVADTALELTNGTYCALAVTGADDYVEGFIVSGMDAKELAALKGPPQGHGPLGTMRMDGLAVYIGNLTEHEKAFGFPPKHPGMKELLGVPIFCGSDVRGALYVTDRRGDKEFSDEDQQVLRVLSRHAALIIEASWY